ncbi:hypothetical protein DFJ73DRAFT_494065 [Zopfochytrium polystomum]|nr:hypothetical protein DFJ73DRAFT_494065 [Zopfochytrium polystomum]
MAVAKEALKVKKQIEKETREQAERDAKLLLQKEMMTDHDRDVPDDMVDAGFEPADLAVYMRWLAMSHRGVRCLTTYLNRVAASPLAERTQILSDYKMIATLSPGKELLNTIDYYEGINIFMSSCPLKLASVEDFLTEFEIQCTHHKIETKIGDEDGRPFAYEVEGRFTYKFSEQIIESTYLPYDGENDQKSISVQAHEKMPEVSLFDAKFSHYTAAVTSFNSNGFPLPEAPKRARADWTSSVIFLPEFEHWQELQEDLIRNRKEQDFEMLCDFDLICCNDVDFVLPRLKDSARRIWEAASKKANIRPTTAKSSILGKTSPRMIGDDDKKEDDGKHFPNTFNLGMLVPSVEERFSEKRVLDAKKQTFGHILRTNEENLLIEQELLNVDPNRTSNAVPVIEPTIATIFSEHEILAFVQLRHVHLRELRETLKRQLNFLRSVERKINMEFECTQRRQPTSYDNIRVQPSTPYQKPTNEQTLNGFSKVPDVFDLKSATRTSHDDVRVIEAGRAVVRDQRGISILYDVAIDDMKQLEKQLIKIATIYINKGLGGREPVSSAYVDELRYRMTDRRTDIKDVTYLNPEADRSQILLELFSHEVKFQYAKIDVINAYLEALEHSVDRKGIDELSQTITNLIHARPHFDFGAPYFSKNYVLATKAFDAQARMVVAATNQLILGHRDWILRCGDSALKAKKDGRPEHEIVESCDTVLPFGLPYSNRKHAEEEKTT